MEVKTIPANECMPLWRGELFAEVVRKRVYGNVSQVWHFPGHILVNTDEGRKLFTFDCKPISQQNAFGSKNLDISNLSTPLIDIIMVSPQNFALVDTSGHLNFWTFKQEFTWAHAGSLDISTQNNVEILSIAHVPDHESIVWCEKQLPSPITSQTTTHCVCQRQLSIDTTQKKGKDQHLPSVVIKDCPPCDVLALTSDVCLITSQHDAEQVTTHMVCDFKQNQLTLYIGDGCSSFPLTEKPFQFPETALKCIAQIIKTQPGEGDLGVRADRTENQAAMLSSSGNVEVFTCVPDSGKTRILRKMLKLPFIVNNTTHLSPKHWFLHRGHLGLLCNSTIQIYRLKDGQQVCAANIDAVRGAENTIYPSSSPAFLAWILTSHELLALQGYETKSKEMYTSPDKLPDNHLLQTDAMKLARLQQLKMSDGHQSVAKELEVLQKRWEERKHSPQHSKISSILAPYVEEYWRLDSLSKSLLDSEKSLAKPDTNSAKALVKTLMQRRSFTKASHHAKLVWLSQVHPQALLDYLCQGITIDCTDVPEGEMKQWQTLLGLEGGDYMNFEFVCRLLFQLQPDKLLNFVKCAEFVSESTVGVSAFVRKKHTLIYYKTASECLPESHMSCDPMTAASVKAKLILASGTGSSIYNKHRVYFNQERSPCESYGNEGENCVDRALKYLLQHKLWSEAVELVKRQTKNEERLPAFLHITVKALAQDQMLSEYAPDLFAIMPSWKSFVSFSQVATERPEIRQQQLSTSAKDVFFQGTSDVSLASVKPCLLDLIKKMDNQR